MEKIPTIIISGTLGKTTTSKYLEYIFQKVLNYKVLQFELNESNLLKNVMINSEEIDISTYRNEYILTGVSFRNLSSLETGLLIYIAKQNGVNLIISRFEMENLDVKLSIITTLDKERRPDFIYIKEKVPVITCGQSDINMNKIKKLCQGKCPLVKSGFRYLKDELKLNTGINSRYGYINLSLALTAANFYINGYKEITFKNNIFRGKYLTPYPDFKDLDFPKCCKKYKIGNVNFYIDKAGSYKSTNLLVHNLYFLNQPMFCIFDCEIYSDLMGILLPLSNLNIDQFYIVDYERKGISFNNIKDNYENKIVKDEIITDWTQTIYECINYIYNNSSFKDIRRTSFYKSDEFFLDYEIDKRIMGDILPPTPIINIDKIIFIKKWIEKLSQNELDNQFNILCTGSSKLINDIFEIFELKNKF